MLGVAVSSYGAWKSGARALPEYVRAHAETLLEVPPGVLTILAQRRVAHE